MKNTEFFITFPYFLQDFNLMTSFAVFLKKKKNISWEEINLDRCVFKDIVKGRIA